MDPALERHEIIFGTTSLLCNTIVSALLATFIKNGGYTTIYYDFGQYGYLWLVLQLPVSSLYSRYRKYIYGIWGILYHEMCNKWLGWHLCGIPSNGVIRF